VKSRVDREENGSRWQGCRGVEIFGTSYPPHTLMECYFRIGDLRACPLILSASNQPNIDGGRTTILGKLRKEIALIIHGLTRIISNVLKSVLKNIS
jgi:hypothetical protein